MRFAPETGFLLFFSRVVLGLLVLLIIFGFFAFIHAFSFAPFKYALVFFISLF